jgi:hypothetical protein
MTDEQMIQARREAIMAWQAQPLGSPVVRSIEFLLDELTEGVAQDLDDPTTPAEVNSRLTGRLAGIRAVRHTLREWRKVELGKVESGGVES